MTGLDANGEHARRIGEHGLVVDGLSSHEARFPCVSQAGDLHGGRFDAIVFPEEFAKVIATEIPLWTGVARANNIKAD